MLCKHLILLRNRFIFNYFVRRFSVKNNLGDHFKYFLGVTHGCVESFGSVDHVEDVFTGWFL